MAKIVDLRGARFGRLFVPIDAEPAVLNHKACWPCVCDCGTLVNVRSSKLRAGRIVSCGCWKKDGAHQKLRYARETAKQKTARRLRQQGLTLAEIGARMGGISAAAVLSLVRYADNSRSREVTRRRAPRCPCGRYCLSYVATIGHVCEGGK